MVVLSLGNAEFLADAVIGYFCPDKVISFTDGDGKVGTFRNFLSVQVQLGPLGRIDGQVTDRLFQFDVHQVRFPGFDRKTRINFLKRRRNDPQLMNPGG